MACQAPPPDNLTKALQLFGHAGFTNKHTKNKMVKLFEDHSGKKKVRPQTQPLHKP
jgi:hypothetical protein